METSKLPRSRLSTLIKITVGEHVYLAETQEISSSEITCLCAAELQDDRPLLISFRLDPRERPISTQATLAWSRPTKDMRYLMALRFSGLAPEEKVAIDGVVRSSGWSG